MTATPHPSGQTNISQFPFQPIISEFLDDLRLQSLSDGYIPHHPGPVRHFLLWLEINDISVDRVDGTVVHQFLRHDCDCRPVDPMGYPFLPWRKRQSSPEIMKFIRFLEKTERIPTPGDLADNLQILDSFLDKLRTEGYVQITIDKYRYGCSTLISWLHISRNRLADIDLHILELFHKREFICSIPGIFHGRMPCQNKPKWNTEIRGFLRYLVDTGRIIDMDTRVKYDRLDLDIFRLWLHRNRGISEKSIDTHLKVIAKILPDIGDDIGQYDAESIRNAIILRLDGRSRYYSKRLTTSLRMYLRFLISEGRIKAGLIHAVPTVPEWKLSTLPRYISPDEVACTLAACGDTPTGRRDRAILLLLSRLALRAGDIVALRLTDIDWNNALLHVSGKSRRETALPLPQDVGDALHDYIVTARPRIAEERVFLLAKAPYRALGGSSTVTAIARSALNRAGVVTHATRGAQVFRHSAATNLLRAGATLDVIGTLLRHQSRKTTAIYSKVDLLMLEDVAQPWIGGDAT